MADKNIQMTQRNATNDGWDNLFPLAKGRASTIIIAASNSTANSKACADYICDGVDDQVEINTAITGLSSSGGTVLLLEGTYNISATINTVNNLTLKGQGNGTKLYLVSGRSTAVNMISANSINITICDLLLDGNASNQTQYCNSIYAFRYDSFSSWACTSIVNCIFQNHKGYGIYAYRANALKVIDNFFIGNLSTDIYSYMATNSNIINGNIFKSGAGTDAKNGEGIKLSGDGVSKCSGSSIICNNHFQSKGFAINLNSGTNNAIVVGNIVENGTTAITISQSSGCMITSNKIIGCNTAISLAGGSLYNLVNNNSVSGGRLIICSKAQSATSTTIVIDATSSSADSTYNGCFIKIIKGTGAGQVKTISTYVGSTKTATVNSAWTTIPDSTSVYYIYDASQLSLGASGITIGSGSNYNKVTDNDLHDVTTAISDSGTGTVTTSGNRTAA
jgi:hypothetical protein